MGILVPQAVLPSGIVLSNVYMSFYSEIIYTSNRGAFFSINSYYRIYNTKDKLPDIPIRFPIVCEVSTIETSIYTILYDQLKKNYPNYIDVIEQPFVYPTNVIVPPAPMTGDEQERGRVLLGNVSNYLQVHLENSELQAAYTAAENAFGNPGAATEELDALELLYSNITSSSA